MLRLKLLLISLLTIISLPGLTAQINVHGTVTDVNGSGQGDINVLVTGFYSDSSFYFESVFTDVSGMYAVNIPSPPLNVLGNIQVSMVDCWGIVVTQDFVVSNSTTEVQADFVYCQQNFPDSCVVFIVEEWVPGAVTSLFAWIPVNFQAEFLWSTGETTQNIYPPSSGEYCVTVSFPWGCTATDCYDYVADSSAQCFTYILSEPLSDSTYTITAVSYGEAPFLYNWSTGETTESITVGSGTFCVTVTDANGCSYSTCVFLDDFSFCEVWITEDPAGGLFAQGYGQPPLTYLWSTGESGEVIYPNQPGLYCVTITDQNQCSASSCYDFGFFPDSCYVFVSPIYNDTTNTFALQAFSSSFGQPVTYLWSTGETTEIIYPTDPDLTYCVTVTDSNGCIASGCFEPYNWCYAWVDVQYVDTTTAVLTVYSDPIFNWGNPNGAIYAWSNGDSTETITVTESGNYCVTVTLSNTCIAEACVYVDFEQLQIECSAWVIQYPDSSGQWYAEVLAWGFGEFTYEWNTGDTTSIIELDYPTQFACVTATSSFGCAVTACVDTFFNPCQTYISINYMPQNLAVLEAYNWNGPGSQYIWSTGQTGSTLTVNVEGTYCVTATGGGCVSEACVEVVFWNIDSCGVWIEETPQPAGIEYTAQAWGVAPFTYAWSNGGTEQSQIIDFGLHDLCVTVTDALGCVSVSCNYDPNQGDTINSISGFVYADSIFAYVQGTVHAYSIDPATGTYQIASSTALENGGFYRFSSLPSGLYLLKAELLPGTAGYDDFIPTYHLSSVSWETADVHVLPNWLPVTTDIWLIPIDTTGGTGVIGGIVTDPQNLMAEEDGAFRGESGVPNVTVLLKNAEGNPLNYKITLQDGTFRFTGLPFGTYRLSFDIPGIHSQDVWVTLSPENPERLQVPLVITEGQVSVDEPEVIQLELYPNPAKEMVTIKIPDTHTDYHIQVVDMQGRIVESGSVKSKDGIMLIEVEQYSPGLYHINLKGENSYYFGRFVKQE